MTNGALKTKAKLRFDFVGMVFAVTIGQVGIEVGNFFAQDVSINNYPHVITQLLLATYIIASSWVGWQKSTSQGNLESLNSLFGKPFLILITDMFLVVCYFIIVKGVDKATDTPSAFFESYWCLIIFLTYVFWDIFTKLIVYKNGKISLDFNSYVSRGYQALMCSALTFLVMRCMTGQTDKYSVVFTDITLLLIFVIFRAFKDPIIDESKPELRTSLIILVRGIPFILLGIFVLLYFFYQN